MRLDDLPVQQMPRTAPQAGDLTRARKAAEQFESFFLFTTLQQMQSTAGDGGLLNNNSAVRTYRQFLHENMAAEITKSGGIGIADTIERELLKFQEVR